MSNNEWITDRLPYTMDEHTVFNQFGEIVNGITIKQGEPWMPITRPKPYVKPKRYDVRYSDDLRCWAITTDSGLLIGSCLFEPLSCLKDKNSDLHREAAERIAAIYEEVMP